MTSPRWTEYEDSVVRREPSPKAAARFLPNRTLDAIKCRRRTLRLCAPAKTKGRRWSAREEIVIHRHFPNFEEIQRRLPNRTLGAIKGHALEKLKLRVGNRISWTGERLQQLSDEGARALAERFGTTLGAIYAARSQHGLTRPQIPNISRAPQVIRDVRHRLEQLGESALGVAKQHGARGALVPMLTVRNYRALRDIVETLGGEFYVDWKD